MNFYAVEAERAILGSMLLEPNHLHENADLLPRHFQLPANQRIFNAIRFLSAAGAEVDPISVGEFLRLRGEIESAGGFEYISDLLTGLARLSTVKHYADILRSNARRKLIHDAGERLKKVAADASLSDTELEAKAEELLAPIRAESEKGYYSGEELVLLMHDDFDRRKARKKAFARFGFTKLDTATKPGMMPGCVAVVGARTSIGKTSFLAGVAGHNVRAGRRVLFLCCEMGAVRNFYRMLAIDSGVPLQRLLNPEDFTREDGILLDPSLDFFAGAKNFRLAYAPAPTPAQVLALVRKAKASMEGLDLLVLDYFQKVRPAKSFDSYFSERTSIVQALVAMAGREEIPLLLGCQLNREAETQEREDEPKKSELKGTGSLEEEATMVILLHRWQIERGEKGARIQNPGAGIHLAKNQDGPTGKYLIHFDPETAAWTD